MDLVARSAGRPGVVAIAAVGSTLTGSWHRSRTVAGYHGGGSSMDIVYTQGGTVAAVVVGKTEDGHPVVVELGKPTVIEPEPGGDDHNPDVHGYSYDIANAPSADALKSGSSKRGW